MLNAQSRDAHIRKRETSAKCRPGQILGFQDYIVRTYQRSGNMQIVPSSKSEGEVSRIFAVDVQLTISVKEAFWHIVIRVGICLGIPRHRPRS